MKQKKQLNFGSNEKNQQYIKFTLNIQLYTYKLSIHKYAIQYSTQQWSLIIIFLSSNDHYISSAYHTSAQNPGIILNRFRCTTHLAIAQAVSSPTSPFTNSTTVRINSCQLFWFAAPIRNTTIGMMNAGTANSTKIPPEAVAKQTLTHLIIFMIYLNRQMLKFIQTKLILLSYYKVKKGYNSKQFNNTKMNKSKQINETKKTKKIVKDNNIKNTNSQNESSGRAKIKDKRFLSAQYDPKFATPSANLGKVKIDKRFADKMKSQKFKLGGQIDKYGRKVVQQSKLGGMGDYYYTQNQDHQIQQQQIEKPQSKKIEKDIKINKNRKEKRIKSSKNPEKDEQQLQYDNQQQQRQNDEDEVRQDQQSEQKYQNNISKWMENYNQQSSDQDQQDFDQLIQDSDSVWSEDNQNVIKNQNVQVTRRLALCNYDWMNISAKDLMLLFSSFKPNSGTILSVSVYYSQFGKDKMKMQELYGPQGIWNEKTDQNNKNQQSQHKYKTTSELKKSRKQQEAFNLRKLRAYEKQRLKYCYAVIQCNSKATADQIYKQCDGNQFQNSNILFDLRFIPDNIKFDPKMFKQKCDEIPISGQVKNFISRATGHSSVSLTWQDPQLNQIASLKKKNWSKMTDKQMEKIDWGVYIDEQNQQANDKFDSMIMRNNRFSDQNEMQQEQNRKQKVTDWRQQCNKKYRKKSQQDDLQITFTSGFDKKIGSKQQKPSLNKQLKSRKQRWRQHEEQKKKRQHLQLLVEKSDKPEFKYDPSDERFKAVLNNPLYYIDPSNPKFDHRKSGAVFQQVVKNIKKKKLE